MAEGDPISYTLADIIVEADGHTGTLEQWQGTGYEAKTTRVTNLDGSIEFEFDDPTGRPENVVVYTNGRPPAEEPAPAAPAQLEAAAADQNGSNS